MSRQLGYARNNPSHAHEKRRVLLRTIAELAGYKLEMSLPDGKRPDVLRLHVGRLGLFVGEAKHTEGPSDFSSVDRLRQYLDWLLLLYQEGVGSILAIAHPCGLGEAWRKRVDWLCQDLGIKGAVGIKKVTSVTTVTSMVFFPDGQLREQPCRTENGLWTLDEGVGDE